MKEMSGEPCGYLEEECCRQREFPSSGMCLAFSKNHKQAYIFGEGRVGKVRSERCGGGTSYMSLACLKDSGI